MTERQNQTVKFRIGGGRTAEVDMQIAASYQGRAGEVIRRILADHVEDAEELQELLNGPVVFDQVVDDVERPVFANDSWSDLVDRMAQAQHAEVGLGKRHTGGAAA